MAKENVLVTGGAGYIGSHAVKALVNSGANVVVVDSLEKGHKLALDKRAKFIKCSLAETSKINDIIRKNEIGSVMHFAGYIEVGESVKFPERFFNNNVVNGLSLLNAMHKNHVKKIIFSSTAAVYGEPADIPIKEDSATVPTNPYGESKLIFERLLSWYSKIYSIRYIALRYFNAAGAEHSGDIGEDHSPETHLIPLVLKTALGQREQIQVFGTDYSTKDGTCIRDYIHVTDLVNAHMLALDFLNKGGESNYYNLGNGNGYSVKEVIGLARKITGRAINATETERRAGDPARLVASSKKIKKELNWKPKYNLTTIIKTAWLWHKNHPDGYEN